MKTLHASKTKVWAAWGSVVGLILACIAFAPAAWLASGIAHASQGRVLLQEARGTVWTGSAHLVLAGGDGSAGAMHLPSRLAWQMSPTGLGLTLTLSAPCCTPSAPLSARVTLAGTGLDWHLHSPALDLPAELLMGLGAPWNTLQLTGQLHFSSQTLAGRWSKDPALTQLSGQATLEAHQMQTALSTVKPLGSYRLSLAGSTLKLETLTTVTEAALVLTGTGDLRQGRARFQGEALAAVGREAALANLLHIIGQKQTSTDQRLRSTLAWG